MDLYKRKLFLLALLLAVYVGISFWVPYSKKVFIQDVMQAKSRLFFTSQSLNSLRDVLTLKAEALNIPLQDTNLITEKINGEVIFIQMSWEEPVNIFFFKTTLSFSPKTFGLIRGFAVDRPDINAEESMAVLAELSDSTTRYLRTKKLQDRLSEYFSN